MSNKSGLTDFVEFLYSVSEEMPITLQFGERTARALKKFGIKPEGREADIQEAKTLYFLSHTDYEDYWSLVELKSNVNESVRQKEEGGENQSYKVKIENGLKTTALSAAIESMAEKLFKGDAEIKNILAVGKVKSKIGKGSLESVISARTGR